MVCLTVFEQPGFDKFTVIIINCYRHVSKLRVFNTFRSYINYNKCNNFPTLRSDERGWLVETVKAGSGGQCFVSSTHPGIVRGNHFHRRKVERFFVLKGDAEIKIRKLLTSDV